MPHDEREVTPIERDKTRYEPSMESIAYLIKGVLTPNGQNCTLSSIIGYSSDHTPNIAVSRPLFEASEATRSCYGII